MKEGCGNGDYPSMGARRGTWKEGFFTGDSEGCLKEGFGNGRLSIGDPLESMEGGGYFTGNFDRKPDIVLSG